MILISTLVDILEQARIIEQKLDYIDSVESTDDTALHLARITSLLGTDATSYNIECIVEFVNENKESIDIKFSEICELVDGGLE